MPTDENPNGVAETETETEAETKRVRSVKYTYLNLDGTADDSFSEEAIAVVANILATKQKISFSLAELWPTAVDQIMSDEADSEGKPLTGLAAIPAMVRMAAVSGMKNTLINAANAKENTTVAEVAAAIEARRDSIIEGVWRDDTRGGPNLKYVLEAVATVFKATKGVDPTPTILAAMKADAKKHGTKFFLDKATIRAEYDAGNVRRAQEAAARSAAAAKDKDKDSLGDMFGNYA